MYGSIELTVECIEKNCQADKPRNSLNKTTTNVRSAKIVYNSGGRFISGSLRNRTATLGKKKTLPAFVPGRQLERFFVFV